MNFEEKKRKNRRKRGQISTEDISPYVDLPFKGLVEMLQGTDPQQRTIAAVILGDLGDERGILPLCSALTTEKSLYSRIAISEALSKIGEPSVVYLIELLGGIGKNQEIMLPDHYFRKKSFPLVRDMVGRTMVLIGKPATPYLIDFLESSDEFKVQQAIDVVGAIAAKTGDRRALNALLTHMERETRDYDGSDGVTLWKIIRALSGFTKSKKAVDPLLEILESDYPPPIIWETLRSLGQIRIATPQVRERVGSFINNEQPEVRVAAENALKLLGFAP
jgi:HEAT repeat protein